MLVKAETGLNGDYLRKIIALLEKHIIMLQLVIMRDCSFKAAVQGENGSFFILM